MYQDFDRTVPDDHDPWPWRAAVGVAIVLILLRELAGVDLGLVSIALVSVVVGIIVLNIRNACKDARRRRGEEARASSRAGKAEASETSEES